MPVHAGKPYPDPFYETRVVFPCLFCKRPTARERGAKYCWDCYHDWYHALQLWAIYIVQRAVDRGILESAKGLRCSDCGGVACRYDHRDYSRPLLVDPVCRVCNMKRGPADYEGCAVGLYSEDAA